ncbi:hypothetical protein ACHMW4_09125 [Mesorhizobium sp. UC22_110]|uniref:hypothetical protein n=1 Tax=unclassified Mesorhizobium TaxID=325217 RepID=UPI00366A59C6
MMLGACRQSEEGQYFEVSGRLFEFNYRLARATYVVTLNPLRPMEDGQVAVASFENPAGGAPFVVKQPVWPKMRHITLTSPALTCVVKDKPYGVSIRIEDPNGKLLQALQTTLISSEDQSVLPDRPLVTGPVYELNPELKDHPDGRLPGAEKPVCPKA